MVWQRSGRTERKVIKRNSEYKYVLNGCRYPGQRLPGEKKARGYRPKVAILPGLVQEAAASA